MSTVHVLALPNFNEDFILETDASEIGMGAVLIQGKHPICYYSRKFCPKMLSASTYVRELCAITSAVKKWRTYLLGRKFIIHTDQRSLRELMTQVIQTPKQQFYLAKLLGFSYEIVYKPGAQNRVADALSRTPEPAQSCFILTIPHWDFVLQLKDQLKTDPQIVELMNNIAQQPADYSDFQIRNELLFYKGKLYIPVSSPIKQTLLEEFHYSLLGGHAGIQRTYGHLKENVYWPGMKQDVIDMVKACLVCQQVKSTTHSPYGLLNPLPIPEGIWEDISLDFVVGLPSFQTYTVILVIVDRLSKAVHLGLLPTHFNASKVAELFAKMICTQHGMPKSIVSDRDPVFLSQFWHEVENVYSLPPSK
jgi:hypothetical protein